MNVHLPQDEISRAEAINIVNANKQYIVPTSGNPIRGLIQVKRNFQYLISACLFKKSFEVHTLVLAKARHCLFGTFNPIFNFRIKLPLCYMTAICTSE